MIEKNYFYKVSEPSLTCVETEKNRFENLLEEYRQNKNRRSITALLRGSRMRTVEDLFQEFSLAFRLPDYFGKNWPALDECLNDLDWLPGDGYIIGINDAHYLLIDEKKEELIILLKILHKTSLEWSTPKDVGEEWGREAKPFHFLLQYSEKDRTSVQERVIGQAELVGFLVKICAL